MFANSTWSKNFIRKLQNKEYREAYVADQTRSKIAFQIRTLREQGERRWSQTELASRMGTKQSVISRLENPDYGKVSLQTLLDAAAAFKVPLLVEFAGWEDWLRRMSDVSVRALERKSFDGERLIEMGNDGLAAAETLSSSTTPVSDDNIVAFPQPWLKEAQLGGAITLQDRTASPYLEEA